MLVIKKATTTPIRIPISIPTDAGRIEGHFTGHAIVRSKQAAALLVRDRLLAVKEKEGEADRLREEGNAEATYAMLQSIHELEERAVRDMYASFEGLGNETGPLEGEAAFTEILTGQFSVQLTAAVQGAYREKYKEAERKN